MPRKMWVALLSSMLTCAYGAEPVPAPTGVQDIYDRDFRKGDLPTGGDFSKHPQNEKLQYYFTNRMRMWSDKTNVQKQPGLYVSADGGQSWKLLDASFEFKELLVHPATATLYAVVNYSGVKTNNVGYIQSFSSDMALRSKDGKHWTNITGGRGYMSDITNIMPDPDSPHRVCLRVNNIRGYVLQSVDDTYSNWSWYSDGEWKKRKDPKSAQSTSSAIGIQPISPATNKPSPATKPQ